MRAIAMFSLLFLFVNNVGMAQTNRQVKVGIAGLTHSHVHWILGNPGSEIAIVGIAEPNRELAGRYAARYGFSMDIVYNTVEEMIARTKPEAVTAFGSIYDHLAVVEACAPKGVHVMVEKPLAVSLDHAKKMKALAEKHKIHLITNYETTWYPSNHHAFEMVGKNEIGELRKIVVHDGHEGPKEIGVNKEFLDWLTDPVKNGGGAIMDFGCYGANLITWLNKGQRPLSVTAVTQQIKPHVYPKVDDEATIIVEYPGMQGVIQASWNWPYSRKDMEVYGVGGYIFSDNRVDMRMRLGKDTVSLAYKAADTLKYRDPFTLLADLVRGATKLPQNDLSSLENNMIVMEILDAGVRSAKTGKRVNLNKK
jgi:predicted dehydrogenase